MALSWPENIDLKASVHTKWPFYWEVMMCCMQLRYPQYSECTQVPPFDNRLLWSLHYGVKQRDNSIEDFVHGYSLPWELEAISLSTPPHMIHILGLAKLIFSFLSHIFSKQVRQVFHYSLSLWISLYQKMQRSSTWLNTAAYYDSNYEIINWVPHVLYTLLLGCRDKKQ